MSSGYLYNTEDAVMKFSQNTYLMVMFEFLKVLYMYLFTSVLKTHCFTFSEIFLIKATDDNTENISRASYKFQHAYSYVVTDFLLFFSFSFLSVFFDGPAEVFNMFDRLLLMQTRMTSILGHTGDKLCDKSSVNLKFCV